MTLPNLNLRELFWLVVVVAMGVCWWVDHQRPIPQRAAPALPPQIGRWQVVVTGKDHNPMLIDTVTGETWRYRDYRWEATPQAEPRK